VGLRGNARPADLHGKYTYREDARSGTFRVNKQQRSN
jgi:hypothetical protein